MGKARIIERTRPDGVKSYAIQQRHFIFRWWWVDAWVNSIYGTMITSSFNSLKEAKKNLPFFDGTKVKEKVIKH
tara:strand:- start:1921 stop:2142 length:222 start_codon:yes stop_codon:yes gene_type:complete